MPLFSKEKRTPKWDPDKIPQHIAIIMDGNGRWAEQRLLPRSAGHSAGAETFRRISLYCKSIGLKYLTVYAFSTENWKRPVEEIETIMKLLEKYLYESLEKLERDKIKMNFFGDVSALTPKLKKLIEQTETVSKKLEGVQVNICVNYGGRDEIIRAAEQYASDKAAGRIPGGFLSEDIFSRYMESNGMPDPDLVIRPSGEIRLSNFMIWQTAYSELYFTDVLWPDFNERELDRAIATFQKRNRRFGGVSV